MKLNPCSFKYVYNILSKSIVLTRAFYHFILYEVFVFYALYISLLSSSGYEAILSCKIIQGHKLEKKMCRRFKL